MNNYQEEERLSYSTKEYGVGREIMNSLALYIYHMNYDPMPNVIQIFNDWSDACRITITDVQTLANILEHIRKLSKANRRDLEKALIYDCLLER